MSKLYNWITFYTEFATKLLEYRNDRKQLIEKLKRIYVNLNWKFPTIEKGKPFDIDPFTVFGLFNKQLADTNRILVLKGIKEEFDIGAEIPSDFSGIPLLNNLSATFYRFREERGEQDIENLWEVHEAAIMLADHDTTNYRNRFIEAYNTVITQKNVRWNLTMALYWIRPYYYINLDSRNRWFMKQPGNAPEDVIEKIVALKDVPKAEEYLAICDLCSAFLQSGTYEYHDFPEFSDAAWRISKEDDEREKEEITELQKQGALGDADVETKHYWTYSPGEGAALWDEQYKRGIIALRWGEAGDILQYKNKEEIKNALRERTNSDWPFKHPGLMLWQFANEMKQGDVIFAKKGLNTIIGRGIVESDYIYSEEEGRYPHIRKVKWVNQGLFTSSENYNIKSLTDITNYPKTVALLNSFFDEEGENEDVEEKSVSYPSYTMKDFLKDVYMDEERYLTLAGLLRNKKNVILQGAPGVGKTFIAKRMAYSIMGVKDVERVMMIQFHQSYAYEDFIMGFRPSATGFELKEGAFYNFCKKAEIDSDHEYFFIIDEINRGNLSKIFGELFMLIENDKRGPKNKLQLLYSDELFYIPENVYIIGMMNTADRSLAMLDYALRRRFAFFDLTPGFKSEGFRIYQEGLDNRQFDALIRTVEALNERIQADESLGEGFCIGHSFFCNLRAEEHLNEHLQSIVEYELIPLLKEYWFDEPLKVKEWSDNLRRAIK